MTEPEQHRPQFDANPGPEPVRGSSPSRVCVMALGTESFAVELGHVREVFKLEAMTPVPGMPPALAGIANLRGTIVPIVDLRALMDLPASARQKYAVVVQEGMRQIGLLIDDVPKLQTIRPDAVQADAAGAGATPHPFLSGLVNIESGPTELVNISKLLEQVEQAIRSDGGVDEDA